MAKGHHKNTHTQRSHVIKVNNLFLKDRQSEHDMDTETESESERETERQREGSYWVKRERE